jgi:hypothetical protein
MTKTEINLLESWVKHQSIDNLNRPLLFSFLVSISELEISNRVERYLKTLIRSITGDNSLTLKSLRKSFASEIFLKFALTEDSHPVLSKLDLLPTHNRQELLNYSSPQSRFWMLADWIGHTTPQTTFQHYALTMDLASFSISDRLFQKNRLFAKSLQFLADDLELNPSAYKNLNRYAPCKFADFYPRFLSHTDFINFDWHQPKYIKFFELEIDLQKLEKVLASFACDVDIEVIAKNTFLDVSTVKRITKSAGMILQTLAKEKDLTHPFKKQMLDSLLSVKYRNNQFHQDKIPKLADQLIASFMLRKSEDFGLIFQLWIEQAAKGINKNKGLYLTTLDNLNTFLSFYNQCFSENFIDNGKGGLFIEVDGTFVATNRLNFNDHKYKSMIQLENQRIINQQKIPTEHFFVSLSTRSFNATKTARSNQALHRAIFLTKIFRDLDGNDKYDKVKT